MSIIKTTMSPKISIGSPTIKGHKMTSAVSGTLNGNTLYVMKSCGKTSDNVLYPICFYKITDFAINPVLTLIKIKDSNGKELNGLARHANSVTFADKYLFVATMNISDQPQVLQISLSGVLKKKILYKKNGINTPLYALDYVGVENGYKKFILSVAGKDGCCVYDYALLKGSVLEYTGVSFTGTIDNKNWTSNDIFYKNGKLYHAFFKKDEQGVITYNRIYCYKNGNLLDVIISNRPKKMDKKYEIEKFFIYKSSWYSICNCGSTNKTYNKDFVVKLTKI